MSVHRPHRHRRRRHARHRARRRGRRRPGARHRERHDRRRGAEAHPRRHPGHHGRHPSAHRRRVEGLVHHQPPARAVRPRAVRRAQPVVDRRRQVDHRACARRRDGCARCCSRRRSQACAVDRLRLRRIAAAYGAFGWADDPQPYFEAVLGSRRPDGVDDATMLHLARLYGTEYLDVLESGRARAPPGSSPLRPRRARLDIAAQAVFAVTHEGARTLADVIDRPSGAGHARTCVARRGRAGGRSGGGPLGWTVETTAAAVEAELARRVRDRGALEPRCGLIGHRSDRAQV